ncbi:MAG: LysR family transcriptional regulator [Pseudobdellovibrio sp.]
MVEGIEALLALERTGTISEAAAQLRLTQSAVSKRIQALENELKYKLIEPDGRRVKLTRKGELFLNRARLLVSELKNLKDLDHDNENESKKFSIALSDSVAASWGPKLIRQSTQKLKNIEFEIHVHRSTLVEENVKLGRYNLGLCISNSSDPQIQSSVILEEPMVLIKPPQENKRLITIERNSGSWRALEDKILKHPKLKNFELNHSESFAAIIQMVKEGYGYGLAPLGIAQTMNVPKNEILVLSPNIKRQIKLISRKNIAQLQVITQFKDTLIQLAKDLK